MKVRFNIDTATSPGRKLEVMNDLEAALGEKIVTRRNWILTTDSDERQVRDALDGLRIDYDIAR